MEHVLALIIGIAIGALVVYRYKISPSVTQSRTYVTDEQRFRKAREVRYVTSWDAEAARNANVAAN